MLIHLTLNFKPLKENKKDTKMSNEIKIELKDIELIKNLVELLEMHFEDLPMNLQKKLKEIEDTGLNDFKAEDFELMYTNADYSKLDFSIDFSSQKVLLSVNKILKKVTYYNDGVKIIYPEHFYLRYDGKTIIEW